MGGEKDIEVDYRSALVFCADSARTTHNGLPQRFKILPMGQPCNGSGDALRSDLRFSNTCELHGRNIDVIEDYPPSILYSNPGRFDDSGIISTMKYYISADLCPFE